jgi:hypothetical protein
MNDESPKLPALVSGGQVRGIIPQTFDEAWRIANAVCMAGMAPYGLNTPEKATIAILHGLEVGMAPMNALQSIAVINGKPAIYGDGALGLVLGSGKMETYKEWLEGEGDARVAYCQVKRRGDPEPKLGKFSVADAKKAKLWMKKGHKGEDTPWVTYEERMLKMRARAFALRDGFADVLKGLAIVEEIRDIEHDANEPKRLPPTPPKPAPAPQKFAETAKKSTPPAPPKPAPKKEPEPEPESFDGETGEITDAEEVSPTDLLTELDISLNACKTPDDVEDVYNEYDLEARLTQMQQGEEFVGVAIGIKRRHLKRVSE